MLTFQKDFTDRIDVILFDLYSNALTWAAQLLVSTVDKGRHLSTERWWKILKVGQSLSRITQLLPPDSSSSSHLSHEHVWVIEFREKMWGWP